MYRDMICDYDEAYTKAEAKEIGFCATCMLPGCRNSRYRGGGPIKQDVMRMSPDDYIKGIAKKDAEIQRLRKIVAEQNENIKIVGRQNTRQASRKDA